MRKSDSETALIPVQSTALTKVGAMSLVARGRADLRIKEEAEDWLKRGVELREQGSYEEAFACFERGIQLEPNHPALQHMLGVMYNHGQGVQQDYVQAAVWFRKAADQGHSGAQNNLGSLYYNGQGVPQDYTPASIWWRKAADQNNMYAQCNLAELHYYAQYYAEAAAWFRKAADQGY